MKYFVVYNPNTYEIVNSGFCDDEVFDRLAIPPNKIIEAIGDAFKNYVKDDVLNSYTAEQMALKSQKMPGYMQWSNESFSWVDTRTQDEKTSAQIQAVTTKRNGLLSTTDWIVIRATDQEVPIPENWRVYRQALRDIDKQSGYPWNVVWPIPPSVA